MRTTSLDSNPWEEFHFNTGKLCPKGVKRYLQSNHQDRLLDPLMRTERVSRKAGWEDARLHRAPLSGRLEAEVPARTP